MSNTLRKRRKHYTTKNNHNGSRLKNKCFIVDPFGNIKNVRKDNIFISKEKGNNNTGAVEKLITMFNREEEIYSNIEVRNYFRELQITSTMNPIKGYEILKNIKTSMVGDQYEHGTGMFPIYNNVWVIGSFGSI